MNGATRLRQVLTDDGLLVAPGAYDCITARMIEQAGNHAVYMTGAGTAGSHGYPDYGLLTMTEMVDNAGRIARAVDIPVVADADTGYGNELNTVRAVRDYEQRGVAGIHIEDQGFPKKCGHLEGKQVIDREDYLTKIRAATGERRDPDFLIIARTDARAVVGFDEAVTRANLALAAGADMAFVEAPQTLEEVREIPNRVDGPCLLNLALGGKTPPVSFATAQDFGFKLAIVPGLLIAATLSAGDSVLREMNETGEAPHAADAIPIKERFRRFGADEWDGFTEKYGQRLA